MVKYLSEIDVVIIEGACLSHPNYKTKKSPCSSRRSFSCRGQSQFPEWPRAHQQPRISFVTWMGPSLSREVDEGGYSNSPRKSQPKSSSESCSEKGHNLHDDRPVSRRFPHDADDGESPGVLRRHWIPGFGIVSSRQPSFLEQMLLPGMRKCETSSDDESAPSQVTIFYAAMVNVYDNVPVDKAHAIMLLAGESCLAKSKAADPQEKTRKGTVNSSNRASLPTIRDLQAGDLPIARKNSLRRFLEKRHDRILSKGPYATSGEDEMVNGSMEPGGGSRSDGRSQRSSLSPFPSRLGYFCPVPSSNRK